MRHSLRLHPDSQTIAVARLEVEITHPNANSLALSYIVTGKINDIRMPSVMPATRGDELWHQTCFEAFVRDSLGSEYYEFNFSPSTQWAAYQFHSYRNGMIAANINVPNIQVRSSPDCFTLRAALELDRMSALSRNAMWRLGLSALIEDTNGRKSYWALTHPPGKPDFHHPDCFTYEFSPAGQT
jgi:hypothetical protein